MEGTVTGTTLRRGVVLNYGGLAAATVVFLVGEYRGWDLGLATALVAALSVLVATFVTTFVRTGLWRLVHTAVANLDEREVEWTHEALRRSYRVITALTLGVLALLSFLVRFSVDLLTFRGHFSLGLALLIALAYLVNTLPAAWLAARRRDWIVG